MSIQRSQLLSFLLFAMGLAAPPILAGEPCCASRGGQVCCANGEQKCCYGPCCCQPRGTLFQWSYGTSFAGGPPGRDEPLVTDRPDFTESATTVGSGVVQLEMGYTYTFNDDAGESLSQNSYPETLFRIGSCVDWLEFRIAWNYLEEETDGPTGTDRDEGAEDLGLGLKIALTPQECCLPEMALILQMSVPTGADAFSADEVLPSAVWAYSWELNDYVGIGANTGFGRALDDVTGEPYLEISQSVAMGFALTEEVGAYVEYFGIYTDGADTNRPQNFFDGGFTFLVNNDFQLDVRGGVGLNQSADDYFVGAGSSFRF